jgi:hypothetical protein
MTADFMPEYYYVPWAGGYIGTYRLYDDKPFKQIPGRVIYPTSGQATAAAKAYVAAGLNPKIEAERIEQEREISEIDAWRHKKAAEAIAERERAFGPAKPAPVRNCAGGQVVVELRRKVRA